ncbi:MAG: hypothetical protein D6702_02670 [Planctomycetota bacterium]|nr:MAG: hypothetical protein D6702_02670 [Planctomycetota bacterium]
MSFLAVLLLAAAAPAQEPELPGGVTILESGELAARLADAREDLAAGEWRRAILALQEILEEDPATLVRAAPDDLLFTGAVAEARRLLSSLPPEAAAVREELVGREASEALRRALRPPDLPALRRVVARYAGTEAAAAAEEAIRELLLDRGQIERATAGRLPEEVLPPEWLPALPAPRPRSPVLAPAVAGGDDPRLPEVVAHGLEERWAYRFRDPPFPRNVYYQNHRAAIGGGLAFLTDGREVAALRLGSGRLAWRFGGDPGWDGLVAPDGGRMSGMEKIVEGFDPKTILAPVLEDGILVVALQEPIFVGRSDSFYRRIAVRRYLPGRRVYAFDAETGRILWKHEPAWYRTRGEESRELVAAPPAAAAGRVFVPIYDASGTLDLSLLALDLHTGRELWRTFLVSGGRETNLFGNVVRELAAQPPAADAERVIVCSNLGAICAVDAATGEALWTRLYRRTWVSAPQTGEIARRAETFANGPPACDGEVFVCAPTDADSAWALRARDGRVVRELRPPSRGVLLRHLVGLVGRRAIFTGSHAVSFDLDGGPARDRVSPLLTEPFTDPRLLQQGGALAADELLVPTSDGILVLDPNDLRPRERVVSWSSLDQGGLQALPGMVLVLVGGGVQAYGSPEGLLRTLPAVPDPEVLARTLPLLEGLDFRRDPAVAARVARAAESLAGGCNNLEQRERLLLLAGSARAARDERVEAIRSLEPVLSGSSPERRRAAALLLLDLVDPTGPASSLLDRALAVLAETPADLRLETRQGELPAGLVLARARALAAAARGRPDRERQALVDLLLLPGADRHRLDGEPADQWAADRLARLLAAEPEQRRRLEEQAEQALAGGAPGPEVLRAFSGTEALQRWLRTEAARPDLDRADRIRVAAWLRDHGGDPEAARELLAAWSEPPPPELPAGLEVLAELPLERKVLIQAAPDDGGGALLALQEGAEVELVRLTRDGPALLVRHRLELPGRSYVPALAGGSFLDPDGLSCFLLDRFLRIGRDGSVSTRPLPGDSQRVAPAAARGFAAVLAEEGGTTHRLQVRDLRTGEALLDRRLELDPDAAKELRFDGERVFVLSARRREIPVFSLLGGEPQLLRAPRGLTTEMAMVQPWGGGLALPDLDPRAPPAVALAAPDRSFSIGLADLPLRLFRAPGGVGWLQRPSFPHPGSPAPRFGWLPDGSDRSRTRLLEEGEVAFPQQPSRVLRQDLVLPTRELLVLDGERRLSLYRLDEDLARAWTVRLPAASGPTATVPPARGRDGWLLPLLVRLRGYGAELSLHRIAADGTLLGSAALEAASAHGSSTSVLLLRDRTALVRNGSRLLLVGRP